MRIANCLLLAALLVAAAGCAPLHTNHNELLKPRTDDGATLLLRRYAPIEPDPQKSPVLLIHGLGASGLNFALPGRSLAEYLRDAGYECFVAELRGNPDTEPATGKRRYAFTIDDHVQRDMPALIQAVLQTTGAQQVNLVGHSMGGVIVGCYMAMLGDAQVHSAVIVASPFVYCDNSGLYQWAAQHLKLVHRLPTFPTGRSQVGLAWLLDAWDLRLETFLYNPENFGRQALLDFSRGGLTATPARVLAQFADNMAEGQNRTYDRSYSYTAHLADIRKPTLWIAGTLDETVPAANVRQGYVLAGGDKTYVLAGRVNGYSVDYGHGDLLIGDNAPAEIFPLIERWLDARQ